MNKNIRKTKLDQPFKTENGFAFPETEIAWKSWGKLNEEKNNVILICHALTGHAAADEWFKGLFVEGGPLDTSRFYVLCINSLGSCYGSTGPSSINPKTGTPYKSTFPEITIRDIVRFQQQLLDELGINGIRLVLGGSMGGMIALEFALMDSRVRAASLIAMGKNHSPWAIGISHAQRRAIYNDPNWKDGNYDDQHPPVHGLATARMMAMITYRSYFEYRDKFERKRQPGKNIFQVESYLNYQGDKLSKRFDANSYITLTKAMDTHDVARERGSYRDVLARLDVPVQVIGINSDRLYPIEEQKELAALIPESTFHEIKSSSGHDAFLIEFEQLNRIITPLLNKNLTILQI